MASAVLDALKEISSRRVLRKQVCFRLQSMKSVRAIFAPIKRLLYKLVLLNVESVMIVPPKLMFTSSDPSKVQSLMVAPAIDRNCKSPEEKSQEERVAKEKKVIRKIAPVKWHMEKLAPEKLQP